DHNQLAFIVYEKRIPIFSGEFVHLGETRKREAIKAMELLGLKKEDLVFLGYPDFGTFSIFKDYWQSKAPYKSLLTRISRVPYKDDLSYGAPYIAENILIDLKTVLKRFRPTKIFVSSPLDVNVDHKAFYLFLQVALSDMEKEMEKPKVYPYLIHWVGWPLPRHYHPGLALVPPKQLWGLPIDWYKYDLPGRELDKKHKSILCYRSQTQSSAFYLLAFARKNELFGNYHDIQLFMPSFQEAVDAQNDISVKDRLAALFGLTQMFQEKSADMAGYYSDTAKSDKKVKYSIEGGNLIIRIAKAEERSRTTKNLIYLFGYSYKVPFKEMPKITIYTKYNRFRVFDSRKLIQESNVDLKLLPGQINLKIPLRLLGFPDYILASVKAYTDKPPVFSTGFRKINIGLAAGQRKGK
ncbi:MAG: hypothetical protein FJZ15_01670, partial [Candidatus Omnitrophica bacterium]|nr:hypothetical protein [Candidatus Omnitrophota bacterium]